MTKELHHVGASGRHRPPQRGRSHRGLRARTDSALWHIWQAEPGKAWSTWHTLGGTLTSEVVGSNNADGRLEVWGRGTDNALGHIRQTGGGWTGWNSLGGTLLTV